MMQIQQWRPSFSRFLDLDVFSVVFVQLERLQEAARFAPSRASESESENDVYNHI